MSSRRKYKINALLILCCLSIISCSSELSVREQADESESEVGSASVGTENADSGSVLESPTPPPPPPPPTPTPTPVIPPGNNVIVASQGVLGWTIDGEWIEVGGPPVALSSIPAEDGDLYRVLRLGSPTSIGVPGSAPLEGARPFLGMQLK